MRYLKLASAYQRSTCVARGTAAFNAACPLVTVLNDLELECASLTVSWFLSPEIEYHVNMQSREHNSIRARAYAAILVCQLCATFLRPALAEETTGKGSDEQIKSLKREEVEFFETRIRPVLAEQCYACHSAKAKRVQAGLLLDTREGMRKGGDSGPALNPGNPEDSLILEAIRYAGLEMPPNKRLSDSVVADFEKWIRMGAPDPRASSEDGANANKGQGKATRSPQSLWSFQPLQRLDVPQSASDEWSYSPVDRFILAKLNAQNLVPTSDARRETLIRRAFLDLVGLPPSAVEVEAFVNDTRSDAFVHVVDQLMASPQFGERWGRHWLDVARYADSSGGGRARIFENAWRYRDYVIASFNADKPFDRFVTEQVAGDLLPHATPDERRDNLIGTGFLALGPTNYEAQDKELLRMDVVDEQIDTAGRAFLALTIGCARCHDHKFDPISTREYYALAGIFRSTKTLIHANISDWIERELPISDEHRRALDEHKRATAPLVAEIKQAKENLKALRSKSTSAQEGDGERRLRNESSEVKAAMKMVADLELKLQTLNAAAPSPPPRTMSIEEEEKPADFQICIRGNVHTLGDLVPRGFLNVAGGSQPGALPANQSGRAELAAWIGSRDNPLTARVIVNRIWLHLMGVGIVRTPDNFGAAGELPSHPELLDWLASDFIAHGWSVKHTVRQIVRSHVYQLSTAMSPQAAGLDPENRLWSRMNRRRLDAEVLRDSMLLAAGRLETTPGGPSVEAGTTSEFGYEYKSLRRSVYVPVLRNELLDLFELFDVADPNLVGGRRNTSTTATQALFFTNSPFVMDCSRAAARDLLNAGVHENAAVIEAAYRQVLGRAPTDGERVATDRFLSEAMQSADSKSIEQTRLHAVAGLYQTLFACIDFRYIE
nr:hypothetical protein [uncultured bacterium]